MRWCSGLKLSLGPFCVVFFCPLVSAQRFHLVYSNVQSLSKKTGANSNWKVEIINGALTSNPKAMGTDCHKVRVKTKREEFDSSVETSVGYKSISNDNTFINAK